MSNVEMRAVFADCLKEIMEKDKNVVLIDADLAKASGTIKLREYFPDRALDVGIAEQNMVSVAAGLASYGNTVFVTTFSPFASRRVCDQITLSVAYSKMNVKIVGTDPGISAELNGGTHMGLEDIGVLRSVPDLVIFEPVDERQLRQAMPQVYALKKPCYIRLFRKSIDDVFDDNYKFDLFKNDVIKEGKEVTIFASGIMTQESVQAVEMLKNEGIDAELINVHTIKPLDKESVLKSLQKTGCAVTAENHNIIGGLFSAISEVAARELPTPIVPIGVNDRFGEVGKLPYLKEVLHMTKEDIVKAAKEAINLKK